MKIFNSKEKMPKKVPAPFTKENLENNKRVQNIVSAMVQQAKNLGIESFIFSFPDEKTGQLLTHLEKIKMSDAVNIHAFGWINSIKSELKAHPEYSEKYVKIFIDAIEEFNAITKKINSRVGDYLKK